ncbi:glutaredoxin [Candidatus Endobugula sertula]|uniref:Glutaredoxin n=1 Tax=Candidatus Endobugula sertula TaxID=62101 RepID=A0A1D2QT64_9GAMM|nr:glutaredoxin [Candidatus Endobugula sertula]
MSRFIIFGRFNCGYCIRAKQLLQAKKFEVRWVDIENEGISKEDLEKTIGKPVETVPQIFHDNTHIGGYSELTEYLQA